MNRIRNPMSVWFMSMFTCGLHSLYFTYRASDELRMYLGQDDISPIRNVLLSIVTFSFYGPFKVGALTAEAQRRAGAQEPADRGVFAWGLNVILGGYGDKLLQEELNRVWIASGEKPVDAVAKWSLIPGFWIGLAPMALIFVNTVLAVVLSADLRDEATSSFFRLTLGATASFVLISLGLLVRAGVQYGRNRSGARYPALWQLRDLMLVSLCLVLPIGLVPVAGIAGPAAGLFGGTLAGCSLLFFVSWLWKFVILLETKLPSFVRRGHAIVVLLGAIWAFAWFAWACAKEWPAWHEIEEIDHRFRGATQEMKIQWILLRFTPMFGHLGSFWVAFLLFFVMLSTTRVALTKWDGPFR